MCEIFISLRFVEAHEEAKILQAALISAGITVFLCDVPEGFNIASTIAHNIDECKLAVVMGTSTYGKDTGAGFSTHEELAMICDDKKAMFLIKMCDRFEVPETRLRLSNGIAHFSWLPSTESPTHRSCRANC